MCKFNARIICAISFVPNANSSKNCGMEIGQMIRQRRRELKLTQEALALEVNSDAGNISRIENGKQSVPLEKIELYAKALNCSVTDLFTDKTKKDEPTLPEGFSKIPCIDEKQAEVWNIIKNQLSHQGITDWVVTSSEYSGSVFAFVVNNERMFPEMKIGDVLIFDSELQPDAGDVVLSLVEDLNEITLSRFQKRGIDQNGQRFELQPANENFETIQSWAYQVKIIGVMVEHRRFRSKK